MNAKEIKKYIYEKNLIKELLEKIGCHSFLPNNNKNELRCALPNEEDNTKVSVFLTEELNVRVFTKGGTIYGSIFDLVMHIYNVSFVDACRKCANLMGLSSNLSKEIYKKESPLSFFKNVKKRREKNEPQQNTYELSILNKYSKTPHIELIRKDGILYDVIEKYHVMFDERSDRIVFPHFKYDDKNKIVGIIGRTVNKAYKELGIPKYFSMEGIKYEKSKNLYGLSHNIDEIKKRGICVVFEAEKSVMKIDMFKDPIGVSVGCHELSSFQVKLLISLNVEIVIAFDKGVDEQHILDTCKKLSKYRKVSYIKDKWGLLKEKDSPADRGYKVWRYLFRNRIQYHEVI